MVRLGSSILGVLAIVVSNGFAQEAGTIPNLPLPSIPPAVRHEKCGDLPEKIELRSGQIEKTDSGLVLVSGKERLALSVPDATMAQVLGSLAQVTLHVRMKPGATEATFVGLEGNIIAGVWRTGSGLDHTVVTNPTALHDDWRSYMVLRIVVTGVRRGADGKLLYAIEDVEKGTRFEDVPGESLKLPQTLSSGIVASLGSAEAQHP
jgi:hypothetical protein